MKISVKLCLAGLFNTALLFLIMAITVVMSNPGMEDPPIAWGIVAMFIASGNIVFLVRLSVFHSDLEVMEAIERPNSFIKPTTAEDVQLELEALEDRFGLRMHILEDKLDDIQEVILGKSKPS